MAKTSASIFWLPNRSHHYTLWLLNPAMEAMAHWKMFWMIYFNAPSQARTKPSEQLPKDREGIFTLLSLGPDQMTNRFLGIWTGFIGSAIGFHLILSDLWLIYPRIYQRDGTGASTTGYGAVHGYRRKGLWITISYDSHEYLADAFLNPPISCFMIIYVLKWFMNPQWFINRKSWLIMVLIGVICVGFGRIQKWFIMLLRQYIPRLNLADVLTNIAGHKMVTLLWCLKFTFFTPIETTIPSG